MTTTFLVPFFNKSEKDKINNKIDVLSPHVVVKNTDGHYAVPAISSDGFPSNRDGTYVFVTRIEKMVKDAYITIGWTSSATVDSSSGCAFPGFGMGGVCLDLESGELWGGTGDHVEEWDELYLPSEITETAKEVISIITISNNGTKKRIQFVVDGKEGDVLDSNYTDFENENGGNEIFCVVTMISQSQKVEIIPFNQVKSRSPRIDELMKEFNKNKIIPSSSTPSTSTSENDAVISQLRDQVARSQDVVIRENEKQMKNMRKMYENQLQVKDQQLVAKDKQLEAKDQQHQQQLQLKDRQLGVKDQKLDLSLSQLELERAEHQKTRNLLHQIKMELKDMEIFYLTREKESGQRRHRQEENDNQFKVKQEPGL